VQRLSAKVEKLRGDSDTKSKVCPSWASANIVTAFKVARCAWKLIGRTRVFDLLQELSEALKGFTEMQRSTQERENELR
jgi:hypothetical protein